MRNVEEDRRVDTFKSFSPVNSDPENQCLSQHRQKNPQLCEGTGRVSLISTDK